MAIPSLTATVRVVFRTLPAVLTALLLIAGASLAASPTDWAGSYPIPTPEEAARFAKPATLKSSSGTPRHLTGDPGPSGVWSLIGPSSGVQRFQPAVVFDPVRQRLMSFGGGDSLLRADIWVFTVGPGTWSKLTTAGTPPSARRLHGAVYDSNGDRLIVFGGYDETNVLSDVWQLSLTGATPTWSELSVAAGPSARAGMLAAFDAANNRALFYGGYALAFDEYGPTYVFSPETWSLSLGTTPAWSQLSTTGTPPDGGLGMTGGFDGATGTLYVFGGAGDEDASIHLHKLTTGGSPEWSIVAASGDPGAREFASGGFDAVSGRFVVYGGIHEFYSEVDSTWSASTYSDVWVIEPGSGSPAWTDVTPDPTILPRWAAGSVVSPAGHLYLVAGVSDHYKLLSDVWKLNVGNPTAWQTWETLFPPRLQEVMVMDSKRHRLIVFGGTDGSYRNDSYVHNLDFGKGWAPLTTTGTRPSARRLHTGIYDPVGDRLIVFGGFDGTFYNDTWQLSFATPTPTWSLLPTNGTPPSKRAGHVAIYDPVGQRMIVSHGYDGVTLPSYRVKDTYALSLSGTPTWSAITTPSAPSGRSSATAIYSEAANAMILFGGTSPTYLNETWSLSLGGSPEWTYFSTTGTPPAREEQSAIYDPVRDRMVIFGGYDRATPSYHNFNDTWSLGFAGSPAWGQLSPEGNLPSERWGMKSVYDPGADGMWMYGGWDHSYSQQLWFLQWSQPTAPLAIATTDAQGHADRATLQWQLPSTPRSGVTIQRSTDGIHWTRVAARLPGGGSLPFTDRSVTSGASYAYRAIVNVPGKSMASAPSWITIPGNVGVETPGTVAFGLSSMGSPSRSGRAMVRCALPSRAAGRVDLLDVAGRVIDTRDLSIFAPGVHPIMLGRSLKSGMYFVRLVHGTRSATLKAIVLD